MSIQRVSKATLIGIQEEKPQVLEALQARGIMHIIPLASGSQQALDTELEVTPDLLRLALQYLVSCPRKHRQVTVEENFGLAKVVGGVVDNRHRHLKLEEQRDALQKRIKELTPWGNFELPEEEDLYGLRLWFYLVPNYQMAEVQRGGLTWSVVHRDNRYSYVAVIADQEPLANRMPVPRTHTGAIPLNLLERQLEEVEIELELIAGEREAMTRWIYLLQRSLAGNADAAERAEVSALTLDRDGVFAIQGWIDQEKQGELAELADQWGLAMTLAEPAADEVPPTLLQNPPMLAGGEEVVRFYQMPGYRTWDPSRVVFFSFAAFFALILSDAGYALLLAAILFFYRHRLGRSVTGRRLRALGIMLALTSLIWGMLVGSYFGAAPPAAVLERFHLLDMNDFNSMMRLSVYIGAGHLILANGLNGLNGWQQGDRRRGLASMGWVVIVVAGLWLWQIRGAVSGWILGGFGCLLVLVCSSDRRGTDLKTVALRGVDGLLALFGVSSMFGDILSYLRLFALGLASASLALTFNQLAQEVAAALPGMGVFLQVLILVVGHLLNFVMAVVSGVIHGLRLNLIEFYNWSLSDEGYLFQPFAKREVSSWIT